MKKSDMVREFAYQTVGSYNANGYGLYDMIGNANEWCADIWQTKTKPFEGWDRTLYVVRGAGFMHSEKAVNASFSNLTDAQKTEYLEKTMHVAERNYGVDKMFHGFRCVKDAH